MTVANTPRKAGPYNGNGATVSFPFTFKVFSASDVLVVRADATGAETTLALTTDYTVSLNADQNASPGGTVTPVVVLATGLTLTIASELDYLQPVDLTNNGGFYPAVINTALDRLTIFVQQLVEKVSRSLKLAISAPSGVDPTLPAPVPYQLLGWNADGTGFQNTDPTYSTALATDLASSIGSSLLGWIQAGTGAVLRTSQNKARDVVNGADFGVTCDGVTNDTAALNLALTYANTLVNGQYRVLKLNPGKCLITPGALQPILCDIDGPRTILIASSNANANLITIGYTGALVNAQTITLNGLRGFGFAYGAADPRYGIGIGFSAAAGNYMSQLRINLFFLEGFIKGINGDCSTGFHIGTTLWSINTLWYCTTGIYAKSGNLEFENNVFNIVYMTMCDKNIYSESAGTAHNVQNIYHIGALELNGIANCEGFSLVGANTNQNLFIVDAIYYNANTHWIVVTDSLANGNEYRLPGVDTTKLSFANDILKVSGFGNLNGTNPSRSELWGAGAPPSSGPWVAGDKYKMNNPTAGGPASYVFTAAGWVVETTAGSGTYTPTATLGVNASAATPYSANWTRNGNIVSVSGSLDITATAGATATELKLTLPVASNLTASIQLSGMLGGLIGNTIAAGYINGDAATDKASLHLSPSTNAATNYSYSFSYPIL